MICHLSCDKLIHSSGFILVSGLDLVKDFVQQEISLWKTELTEAIKLVLAIPQFTFSYITWANKG